MHQHLYAAAAQATAITPQQARNLGYVIAVVAALILLSKVWNALFGKSKG